MGKGLNLWHSGLYSSEHGRRFWGGEGGEWLCGYIEINTVYGGLIMIIVFNLLCVEEDVLSSLEIFLIKLILTR